MKKILLSIIFVLIGISGSAQKRGYEKAVDITNGIGLTEQTDFYSIGVSMINGYRVNPNIFVGAGLGFRIGNYNPLVGNSPTKYSLPAFLRAKINLTRTKVSPYILADVGYVFDLGKKDPSDYPYADIKGWFVEPQIGIDLKRSDKLTFSFGVGFHNQKLKQEYHQDYLYSPLYVAMVSAFTDMRLHFTIKF